MPRVTPKGNMDEQQTRYGPRPLDPIKAMVAQAVQHHLVTGEARPPLPDMVRTVDKTEGFIVSPTETTIRVTEDDGSVRSFSVVLREIAR